MVQLDFRTLNGRRPAALHGLITSARGGRIHPEYVSERIEVLAAPFPVTLRSGVSAIVGEKR
jgi:hypothetical protein